MQGSAARRIQRPGPSRCHTRAHRHSARERLDAGQPARKQCKSFQRLRVPEDMCFIRADAFDAMIHRTTVPNTTSSI